ncbi:GNAT family N-acetyltransferase [Photobacterium galatheae]|uniref:Acyltransferase n=1 Tax=Photobacterium galatheae TaxID=1654360 RepID=A0A066RH72_9GAMM|nr:GNAT family N-acetyltransferase [Photobacterium galatheae]KDM89654.1 acyltransferase [Photobacterium galatheae]MCM0151728.1 GNAT family N-acetyltransferase [Photobacterium galatheae]
MTDFTKTTLSFHPLKPIRFPLINRLYKAHYPAGKAKRDEIIWIGETTSEIVTVVRFQLSDDHQLLTGMLVAPTFRQQGVGLALLEACRTQLLSRRCFCFAFSHLEPLYQKAGFIVIDEVRLPASLANRLQRYRSAGKSLIPMQYSPN